MSGRYRNESFDRFLSRPPSMGMPASLAVFLRPPRATLIPAACCHLLMHRIFLSRLHICRVRVVLHCEHDQPYLPVAIQSMVPLSQKMERRIGEMRGGIAVRQL